MRQMKDSGIEWIGEIPQEWDIVRVKHIFNIGRGRVIAQHELEEAGFPVYSSQTQNDGCLGYISTFDYDCSQLTWTTDGANAGTVFLREGKHNCTNVCGTLTPKNDLNNLEYLKYALEYIAIFHKRADTNGYKIMNNEMAEIDVVLPDKASQDKIADYLDTKCAEIDALIEAKEKTNALLKERRQSTIYEAVTKGLDPTVPMKDSGIEWIGMIPEDWGTRKIKYCFEVYAGATPKSGNSEFWDGDIIWVTPADYTTEQKYINAGRKNITQEGFESCSTELIPAGSLIFSKRAPIGLVAINTVDMCTNQGCLSCVPTANNDVEYFYYAFSCFTEQFDLYGSGTTFKEISADAFMNFAIPYPAPEAQRQISDYLRGKCAEMDTLISANEATIQKLKEYRQSIIYEAVTGKIEV